MRRHKCVDMIPIAAISAVAVDAGRGFASWSAACDRSAEQSFKTGDKLCCAKRSHISFSSPRNKTEGNRYRVDAFRRRGLVVTPPFILMFFLDATGRRSKPILPSKLWPRGAGQYAAPLDDLGGRENKRFGHLGKTKDLAALFGHLEETRDLAATRTGTARS
jgi:hypothetical protein